MSTVPESRHPAMMTPGAEQEWSPWAAGLAIFAGAVMMLVGLFQVLQGVVALIDDEFFVVTDKYTFETDVTAWGWIHLILGAVVAATGYFVVRGNLWARVVAMFVAGLAAIANFLWAPYYPLWAILMIALDIVIICALAIYHPTRA